MAFMAILVPVLLSAVNVATRASVSAERSTAALQLAENKLNELIVMKTWSSGETNGDFGEDWPNYHWELVTADWPESSDMTELTMVVTYEVQGQERTVELTTLAATSSS